MKKFRKNNKKGFTLIELIVVVAILVALMLMLVPRLTGFTDEATKTANAANARAVYTAIQASETAKETKLFSGKTVEEVDLCGQKVYKTFWDDAKVPGTTVCKYENNKVTYGLDQKEAVRGVYPIPETPTTPEK